MALDRGVDLSEHGHFRATVAVAAAAAASGSLALELELLDLGAHAAGDALGADALAGANGLPPLFALETDGGNQAKIGPAFRADAADRVTHGRLRTGRDRGPVLLRDLEQRPLPAAFAQDKAHIQESRLKVTSLGVDFDSQFYYKSPIKITVFNALRDPP